MITSAFCTHKCNIFRMAKYFYDNVEKNNAETQVPALFFLCYCLFPFQHSTWTRLTMMAATTPMTTPAITPLRIRKGR